MLFLFKYKKHIDRLLKRLRVEVHLWEARDFSRVRFHENTDYTQLVIKASETDGAGGKITIKDIDRLADYPDVKSVTILGLSQDTFEYFINTYGQQLKYICFW